VVVRGERAAGLRRARSRGHPGRRRGQGIGHPLGRGRCSSPSSSC
jgi:hypothetical protein